MSRVFSVVAASSEARERRTERQTTRARRARRARTPRVALAAAVEQGRSRAVLVFSSSSSLRVCRSARAAPSLYPLRRVVRSPRARARRTQRTARRARCMGSPSAARSRSTRSAFAGSRQTAVLLGFAPRAPSTYLKEKGNFMVCRAAGSRGSSWHGRFFLSEQGLC